MPRSLKHGLGLAAALLALSGPTVARADQAAWVNPFVGTDTNLPDAGTGGGAGATFPGAVAPHGMLQFSPDSVPSITNFAAGYTYRDSELRGFSLTHMSGAGCATLEDVPIVPTTGAITTSPAVAGSSDLAARYVARFRHSDEAAHPGAYAVALNPGSGHAIGVELTAAGTRTALGRFQYPRTAARGDVLIDAGGSAMGDYRAGVSIDPRRHLITGTAQSGEFCLQTMRYRLYFAAQFSRPFSAYGTWQRQRLEPGAHRSADVAASATNILTYKPIAGGPPSIPGDPSQGAQTGAYVGFGTRGRAGRSVLMRVAISSVSARQAVLNLHSEGSSWDFAATRRAMRTRWDRALSAITVTGGRPRDRTVFETSLYHTLLEPQTYSDANSLYRGMDNRVHRARGYVQYANFSGWDVYRSEVPLTAMIDPRIASDQVRSLLADQRQSGWLPKWSLYNGQTEVMVGDPADPTIAGTYAFGARGFDTRAALRAMIHGATATGTSRNDGYVERQGLRAYERLHYVPEELNHDGGGSTIADPSVVWGSGATTLEYAAADFAIGRFAGATGSPAVCRRFVARSGDWRNEFDPATGYLEPRHADGAFDPGTDPARVSGWVEGSTAQYTWFVPYDVAGLFARMGGPAAARARLDRFFKALDAGPASPYAFLGNEPTLQTPWLYDWAGAPQRAQATVRRALLALYGPGADGFPGNDDLGTMSAWVVFADLGLYPEIPGSDVLALNSPLFTRAVVRLPHGRLTITGRGAGPERPYIRGLSLNGHRYRRDWVTFSALASGGRLRFTLAARPGGHALAGAPPSYAPGICGEPSPQR